jgi:hypothetical protein
VLRSVLQRYGVLFATPAVAAEHGRSDVAEVAAAVLDDFSRISALSSTSC